jgi:hypothetical protein
MSLKESPDALKGIGKYSPGRWRKLKGTATVRLAQGVLCTAEVHWYEAHGVGKKEFKIKSILEK